MFPVLPWGFPAYYAMWLVGDLVAGAVTAIWASREHERVGAALAGVLLIFCIVAAGAKLQYLLEALWFPYDDYVPMALRGPLHGFRIPGGVLAATLAMGPVGVLLKLRRDWFVLVASVAVCILLVCVRVGCFLNGCCFGAPTAGPLSMSWPGGSWAWAYQITHGMLDDRATHSLAVHPLQLYFVVAASVLIPTVIHLHRRGWGANLVLLVGFGASSLMLEPLRGNLLHLNYAVLLGMVVLGGWRLQLMKRNTQDGR